jgi:hypothetical protein
MFIMSFQHIYAMFKIARYINKNWKRDLNSSVIKIKYFRNGIKKYIYVYIEKIYYCVNTQYIA